MYDFAWRFALKWEGGLTDDPKDPGGITKYGVDFRMLSDMARNSKTKAFLRDLGVCLPVTRDTIKALTIPQAKAIYKYKYWDPLECGRFPLPVACCLFDAGMLNGMNSVKFMQRAHNVLKPKSPLVVDGKLGPKTRAALLTDDANKLARIAIEKREYWFRSHVKVVPAHKKFLNGWLNRCADLRKTLGL